MPSRPLIQADIVGGLSGTILARAGGAVVAPALPAALAAAGGPAGFDGQIEPE